MPKIAVLLEKCKSIEKSLLEMEIRMIITLINSGISRETANNIVKKTIEESNYSLELKSLKHEIDNIRTIENE
jgi:hypothetical protein